MCGGGFFPESRTSRQLDPLFPDLFGSVASQVFVLGATRRVAVCGKARTEARDAFILTEC